MDRQMFRLELENALHAVTRADQILDSAERYIPETPNGDDVFKEPWQAAHVCIARAMCLLIDSLEGVEEVEFSTSESVPIARTRNPYSYLSKKYGARAKRYDEMSDEVGSLWDSKD